MSRGLKASVAIYFYRLGAQGGGAERMICALADALVDRGMTVHLASWDNTNAQTFYPLNSEIGWSRLGYSSGILDKVRRIRALTRVLREKRIGVLVGFVMSGDKTVYVAAKLAGVRLIAAERNSPTMYYLRYGLAERWLRFALLHLADRITVQMPEFRVGYPATLWRRIEAIPNPVPEAARCAEPSRPNSNGRFTLLAVGRLDNVQKRLHCLVRAFARVANYHMDWDLRIIGDGPMEAMLNQLAVRLGVTERVFVETSRPDIFAAYTDAHLFAIPSLWEGFPNALAEALAHGLPAIGFRDADGVAQLIADGKTGWLANGLDDELELTRVLDIAMADDKERGRRGVRAARSVAIYHTGEQLDRWAKLLEPFLVETTR